MGKPATYLVETADAESEPEEWDFRHGQELIDVADYDWAELIPRGCYVPKSIKQAYLKKISLPDRHYFVEFCKRRLLRHIG